MLYESLRDYQRDCIEQLRDGVRNGNRSQVLVAPTGGGKTVMASYLLSEAVSKGSVAWFVCDRVSLVDQTSTMLDKYGVKHGVIQADHWRNRPYEYVQVVSAQTLARREVKNPPKIIIWDECHTMYKSVINLIEKYPDAKVVGLTATPFTKGMGSVFTNVVNSTTTNQLISDGWLVPLKCYLAKATIDMTGAGTKFDGEWKDAEMEERGIKIVGDIVGEWESKTLQHFGGPVKTIVFSATVAHGQAICRAFAEKGYNFQQISYLDGNDERRRSLIEEFRKTDSMITGLVSCEALAKGFDVTDIKCGIAARPYRKSLSGHIQQMGRVMRPHEGKEFALWLDHTGNLHRFAEDQMEVFQQGVKDLEAGDYDQKVRKEKDEEDKEQHECGECGYFFDGKICPSCGWERPTRKSQVIEQAGEMHEFKLTKTQDAFSNRQDVWEQLCWIAEDRKGANDAAKRFAMAQYKNIYGVWPKWNFKDSMRTFPSKQVQNRVTSNLIAFYRSKQQGKRI